MEFEGFVLRLKVLNAMDGWQLLSRKGFVSKPTQSVVCLSLTLIISKGSWLKLSVPKPRFMVPSYKFMNV